MGRVLASMSGELRCGLIGIGPIPLYTSGTGVGVSVQQVQFCGISLVSILIHRVGEAGGVRGGPRAGDLWDNIWADSCARRSRSYLLCDGGGGRVQGAGSVPAVFIGLIIQRATTVA